MAVANSNHGGASSARHAVDVNEDNLAFVEGLYFQYQSDPASVDERWRAYFERADAESTARPRQIGPSFRPRSIFAPAAPAASAGSAEPINWVTARGVQLLIDAYRERGHAGADVNPIKSRPELPEDLRPQTYGITASDLDTIVESTGITGLPVASVREIIDVLHRSYCGHVAVEMGYIQSRAVRTWLTEQMEAAAGRHELSAEESAYALRRLTRAETFEQFLHTKFVGAKRFSLEGGEGLIPLLDFALDEGAARGVKQLYIGMAHRGRLNVLTHVIRKDPRDIFLEFEDVDPLSHLGSGDVKYHKGTRSDTVTVSGHKLRVALNFNPSHLEFVYPVVTGRVYALQAREAGGDTREIVPLVIHGDASVIGQGIVPETLNMAGLPGYTVGGCIHVVVNNQIGFTTPWSQARSSSNATAVAQIADAPVFRVHGDDVEALAWVARTAMRFRQQFGKDVFIDLICFRKYGHNEGDEPNFTQPLMYERVRKHPGARELYARRLTSAGTVGADVPQQFIDSYNAELNQALDDVRAGTYVPPPLKRHGAPIWDNYVGGRDRDVPDVPTNVPVETLERLLHHMGTTPDNFEAHRGIKRVLAARIEAAEGKRPLDWGMGEALAFATLIQEGVNVRLSGQDAERGTFAHRHSVLHDQNDGSVYVPLRTIAPANGAPPGTYDVVNSPLSEQAVMGFDYGYSREAPDALVMWEAQFGDFSNGAQVIIDQFVSAGEDKWGILSGLTLLLPHGFEGQGPEHSSARLERFLALCAQDNMTICNFTTPAQLFHALRRQVMRPIRKPLVVMTPKSLLRHKLCVSTLEAFSEGQFQRVIGDRGGEAGTGVDPSKVRRIVLCTGKIYYDLAAYRDEHEVDDVAIIRMEQLYPLPKRELLAELASYPDGLDLVWVQEEPWNMGAWYYMRARLPHLLGDRFKLRCMSRAESASPATGSKAAHEIEQSSLVQLALTGDVFDTSPDTSPIEALRIATA